MSVCVCVCCALCTVAEKLLKRSVVTTMRVLGSTVTLNRSSSQADDKESCTTHAGRCIVVSGITPDLDVENDLCPPLENKRKGGGKVDKTTRLTKDSVLITFADQSSMVTVLLNVLLNATP